MLGWLRGIFRRKEVEAVMDEEVRFHLAARTEDLMRSGLSEERARRAANLEFGGVEGQKEDMREALGLRWFDELRQDLLYARRSLLRSPGFAATAVLTLALGLGANTAVFSIFHSVLLRPLPFPDPDRLVCLYTFNRPDRIAKGPTSYADYRTWEQSGVFDSVGLYLPWSTTIALPGGAERIPVMTATRGFFLALGVQPILGHIFTPEEDQPSPVPVVLLSERLWRDRLGADPNIVGRALRVDGRAATVVGVLPNSFRFPGEAEFWLSMEKSDNLPPRDNRYWSSLARIRPDSNFAAASAAFSALNQRMARDFPATNRDWGAETVPLLESFVGPVRPQFLLMLGAVGLVFLIVCVNVATLMLVRGMGRQREFTVRTALGAGRGRILRQLLTEGALLAFIGGVLGIAVAQAVLQLLKQHAPNDLPRIGEAHLSFPALGVALALCALTALIFGLLPGWQLLRCSAAPNLHSGARGASAGRSQGVLRNTLVTAEIALSLILLIGAGLLVRSFLLLNSVTPGFLTDHLLAFVVQLPTGRVNSAGEPSFELTGSIMRQALEKVRSVPGVQAAGLGMYLPLGGGGYQIWQHLTVPGRESAPVIGINQGVTPGYLEALGIPLLRGRNFTDADGPNTRPIVMINQTLASEMFGSGDPVGKFMLAEAGKIPLEIVGVVGDIKSGGLHEPSPPQMFSPYWQQPSAFACVFIRSPGDPLALSAAVRAAVSSVDPEIVPFRVRSGDEMLALCLAERRFLLWLIAVFAAAALSLASLGLYGVISYSVAQRTREIGIRMALGASVGAVLAHVLQQGMALALAGAALGLAAAMLFTKLLSGLLYSIAPNDPVTLTAVPLALLAVALCACLLPALRAARVDPATTLRDE